MHSLWIGMRLSSELLLERPHCLQRQLRIIILMLFFVWVGLLLVEMRTVLDGGLQARAEEHWQTGCIRGKDLQLEIGPQPALISLQGFFSWFVKCIPEAHCYASECTLLRVSVFSFLFFSFTVVLFLSFLWKALHAHARWWKKHVIALSVGHSPMSGVKFPQRLTPSLALSLLLSLSFSLSILQ